MKIQKTTEKVRISLPYEWENKKIDHMIKLLAIEFQATQFYNVSTKGVEGVTFEFNDEIINDDLFINVLIGDLLNNGLCLDKTEGNIITLKDIS